MTLVELQQQADALLTQDKQEEALNLILDQLKETAPSRKLFLLQQGRLAALRRDDHTGGLAYDDRTRTRNEIRTAIQGLLNDIEADDLRPAPAPGDIPTRSDIPTPVQTPNLGVSSPNLGVSNVDRSPPAGVSDLGIPNPTAPQLAALEAQGLRRQAELLLQKINRTREALALEDDPTRQLRYETQLDKWEQEWQNLKKRAGL